MATRVLTSTRRTAVTGVALLRVQASLLAFVFRLAMASPGTPRNCTPPLALEPRLAHDSRFSALDFLLSADSVTCLRTCNACVLRFICCWKRSSYDMDQAEEQRAVKELAAIERGKALERETKRVVQTAVVMSSGVVAAGMVAGRRSLAGAVSQQII